MKQVRIVLIVFLISIFINNADTFAQCAMCSANAENSVANGNTEGKGLNDGILYLLVAPYLAVGIVGFVWYRKYRRKNVALDIRDERINLN